MGNCQTISQTRALSRKKRKPLPIETIFKLPTKVPSWPPGEGFASGEINLGPILVRQISTFVKVWATHEGGPGNAGATFFEPSPIPEGFHMLGCYSQPNNKPLFGWVLVARAEEEENDDEEEAGPTALAEPIDYTLVWSSERLKIKRDGDGYIWLPTPPEGYKAAGFFITDTPEKPPLGKARCVRADLTEQCEGEAWIWGPEGTDLNTFNIFTLRLTNRGAQALGVPVGTFAAQTGGATAVPPTLACLKNANNSNNLHRSMPNLPQLDALFGAYSPLIYFHPDEKYLPSSVTWYFENGALLYKKGEESTPSAIERSGSNLPQGGANDGEYWLDIPRGDKTAAERIKNGDLATAEVYLHAKPVFGSTYTDAAAWIFYPFNGPARAKVGPLNVSLGRIGEHVGDWEHVTLRVSNFSGELERLYLSEHSKGKWVEASELEFGGAAKPVAYASLHGHAQYAKPGVVLQGGGVVGIRNDTGKSKMVMDSGEKYAVVAVDYLAVEEPPWLNYLRKWGPKIEYDTKEEAEKVAKVLPGPLKKAFRKFVDGLPSEVFGEEGPTGPKVKASWVGDEPY